MSPTAGPVLNCQYCRLGLFHTHCPGCLAAREEAGLCSTCRRAQDPNGPWLGLAVFLLAVLSWALIVYQLYPWEAAPVVNPNLLDPLRRP